MPLVSEHPAFQSFAQVIARVTQPLALQPATLARLAVASDLRRPERGEHLLRVGDTAGHLFFVVSGLLRYYYADPGSGEERTGQFFDEGQVFTDAASFLGRTRATQFIEALEPSEPL